MSAREYLTNCRPLMWVAVAVCFLLAALVALTVQLSRHRPPGMVSPTSSLTPSTSPPSSPSSLDFAVEPTATFEGDAKWYAVPPQSLAQRRAWPGEFTAASDRLPQEAYVRVRRVDGQGDPDKTIIVRITDNGVHDKATLIDLDRQAAEALGMVRAGQVRVRVEVLALKNASADKPVEKRGAPGTTKVGAVTDKPTASEEQERAASSAKP